jgi:cell division protein FtsW
MTGTTTHIGPGPRTLAKDRRSSQRRHPAAAGTRVRRRPRQAPPPTSFYVLLLSVFVLCMLGLVMVLSASSIDALRQGTSGWTYFGRQALWATLGVVALVVAYRTPHRIVRALVVPGLLIVFALNVAVAIPRVGVQVNGARAWFDLGPFGFQPSELLKLVLLVYAADLLSRRADRMGDLRATFRPLMIMLALASTLVLLQGDLGSAIVLATIVLAVAFIGGTPLGPLAAAGASLFFAGAVFITSVPYRRERWLSFLDLANSRQDAGFQVWQSLIGIASGGVPGTGLGAGRAKWGYLPESHTDFIFAVLAEELGLIGVIGVIGLFLVILYLGVSTSLRAADRFSQLLAGGITAWIAVQAMINIGGVTGMLPVTGLTLPFLSFGGTSLLVTMTAAGLLLGCARTSR